MRESHHLLDNKQAAPGNDIKSDAGFQLVSICPGIPCVESTIPI
jgi:hypothetical protein